MTCWLAHSVCRCLPCKARCMQPRSFEVDFPWCTETTTSLFRCRLGRHRPFQSSSRQEDRKRKDRKEEGRLGRLGKLGRLTGNNAVPACSDKWNRVGNVRQGQTSSQNLHAPALHPLLQQWSNYWGRLQITCPAGVLLLFAFCIIVYNII